MISGLRKNRGPLTPEIFAFDKHINPTTQSALRQNPISADSLVTDEDMLDHVLTVKKPGPAISYTGPKVDQFGGLRNDEYLGIISSTIRKNPKITGVTTNLVGYGENLRKPVHRDLDDKLFRDHQSLLTTYCINPTIKKHAGRTDSYKFRDRMAYLLFDNDYSMGIRKVATDDRVLSVICEHVDRIQAAMIQYRKDASVELHLENLLRENKEILITTIRELEKEATAEMRIKLRDRLEVLHSIEREFKDRKTQYRKIKLRKRKEFATNIATGYIEKEATKDERQPIKDDTYVDTRVVQGADVNIPRIGY